MKSFDRFIEEAATKRCPPGKYYCFDDKKCKKMPRGYFVGRGGYLEKDKSNDNDSEDSNGTKNGGSNGGNGSNGNGNGGNGSGGNGGGNGGGGGE
tara:strand:+ start:20 stop:304 length:285 start_codon:yes stop_codon:yes gene_type:complete